MNKVRTACCQATGNLPPSIGYVYSLLKSFPQVLLHIMQIIGWNSSIGSFIASFPGPAQLSVASSTEKRERAWNNLSRE